MQLGQACATCENASKFSSNQTAAEAPVDKKLELRKSCSSRLQKVMKCSSSLSSRGKATKMLELRHPVQDRLSYAQPYTVEMFNKKAKGQTCFFFFFTVA